MARKIASLPMVAISLSMVTLSACGGGDGRSAPPINVAPTPTPAPTPAPTPTPTPTPTTANVNVLPCLEQIVPTNLNRTRPNTRVVDLVIPDTITLYPDLTQAFPNGRQLADPVIDITLAVILLDLDAPGQNAASFATLPLNPAASERAPRAEFPFAALPHGNPVLDPGTGTNFVFDLSPISQYVQVDRAGMPAVATALILGPRKNAYNDSNVQADTANTFTFDLVEGLRVFSNLLQDELRAFNLTPCAVPRA